MIIPIQPYRTNKPFIYKGVRFSTGDLFLPDVLGVPQHKLNALLGARNIGLTGSATEEELKKARERIEAALAGVAQPKQVNKPEKAEEPKESAPAVKDAPEKEEEGEPVAVTPAVELRSDEVVGEGQESAEEGQEDVLEEESKRPRRRR